MAAGGEHRNSPAQLLPPCQIQARHSSVSSQGASRAKQRELPATGKGLTPNGQGRRDKSRLIICTPVQGNSGAAEISVGDSKFTRRFKEPDLKILLIPRNCDLVLLKPLPIFNGIHIHL